jgi:hypothetical protein
VVTLFLGVTMDMTLKPPRNYPLPLMNAMFVFISGSRINEAVSEEEALQLAHNANSVAAAAAAASASSSGGRHGNVTGPTPQEIMAQTAAMRQLAAKREGTKAWAVSTEIPKKKERKKENANDNTCSQRRQEEEDSGGRQWGFVFNGRTW